MQKFLFKLRLQSDSLVNSRARKSVTRNILSIAVCITLAIVVALLITLAIGYNPLTIFVNLFTKGFIDYKTLIWNIAILGIGGLSFSFAFKAGVFNIGIPGQMMMSGLMVLVITTAINNAGVKLPTGVGPIITILIAIVFGSIVATITSLLKVFLNVNDVVSAILLNWIIFFTTRLVVYKFYNPDTSSALSQSTSIPEQFQLTMSGYGGWIPTLIVFGILVIGVFIICKYTTYGHKIASVGANFDASAYAGYNVKNIKISTMAISGSLAGIMGVILYTAGQSPTIPVSFDFDTLPVQGLNGIAIGLIALNNPIAIVPVAFIIGLFNSSATFLEVSPSFSQLIMGLVIFGAAMFVVLLNYHPWLWFQKQIYGYRVIKEYRKYENNLETLISKYRLQLLENENDKNIEELKAKYLLDRKEIINQYKKELILLKATNSFTPYVEAKGAYEYKNNKYQQQYIHYTIRQNKKVQKLQDKYNSQFKNLVGCHNKLFKKYNKLIRKSDIINKNFKLPDLLAYYSAQVNQKYQLVNTALERSKESATIANGLNKELEIYHSIVKKINDEDQYEAIVKFLNLQYKPNSEIKEVLRKNFLMLTRIQKSKILLAYKYYYRFLTKNHKDQKLVNEGQKWTVKEFKNYLKDLEFYLTPDKKLDKIAMSFSNKYKVKVNQLVFLGQKINTTQTTVDQKIAKAHKQVEKWKENTIAYETRYYERRSRLLGSSKGKYEHYLKQASKLELLDNGQENLNNQIKKLYQEHQENMQREGQ